MAQTTLDFPFYRRSYFLSPFHVQDTLDGIYDCFFKGVAEYGIKICLVVRYDVGYIFHVKIMVANKQIFPSPEERVKLAIRRILESVCVRNDCYINKQYEIKFMTNKFQIM